MSRNQDDNLSSVAANSNIEPYVGPRPFKREDRDIFFGRYRETLELTALIKAHPEVLIYAQSGAGKTSLIDAQLVPTLEIEEEFDVLPLARVRSQVGVPIADEKIKNIYMFNALADLSENRLNLVERSQLTLADYLKRRPRPPIGPPEDTEESTEIQTPTEIEDQKELRLARAIIFDQFEELFTLYPHRYKDRQDFFQQILVALEADPFLRIVFSMREDYIAELDPYIDILPQKLCTRFRLERLRKPNALAAVTEPLNADRINSERKFEETAAESLVHSLMLIKVRTAAGEKKEVPGEFVDPVQLQVVCQTLWEKLPAEVTTITEAHLAEYANIDAALSSYYENSIRKAIAASNGAVVEIPTASEVTEGKVRRWFEKFLITAEGKRNMVFRGDKKTGTLQNCVVDELENQHLIRVEIRGDDKWYELSHDRLILPILEANRRWIRRQPLAKQKADELETRTLEWINAEKDKGLLLNRGEVMEAQHWRQSAEAEAIGCTSELELFIRESEAAIQAEDRKQLRLIAHAQQERANAEHQRARQFKFGLGIAIVLLVIASGATLYAFAAERRAKLQEARANEETKRATDALTATKAAEAQAKAEAKRAGEAEAQAIAEAQRANDAEDLAKAETKRANQLKAKAEAETRRANNLVAEKEIAKRKAERAKEQSDQKTNEIQSLVVSRDINKYLPTDPELSLSLAIAAADKWPSFSDVRYGLRSAYVNWPTKHFVLHDDEASMETSVENAVFTPDGKSIITTGVIEGGNPGEAIVKIWNVDDRKVRLNKVGHNRGIPAIAVSYDSTRLATEGADGTGRIWWLEDGSYKELKGLTGPVPAIAFSRDAKLLATEGTVDDKKPGWAILIWDAEDRQNAEPLLRLVGHNAAVTAIGFSPKENFVATASEDKTVRIWNVKTGDLIHTLTGHTERVNTVSFDPSGKFLVTASDDGTARIWDKNAGKELRKLTGHVGIVTRATFSTDGQQILTITTNKNSSKPEDNFVRVWNADTGDLEFIIGGHTARITAASFSSNGDMIVTASRDGTAHLWDAQTGVHLMKLEGHKGWVSSALFSPDNTSVLTVGTDNSLHVWRIPEDVLTPKFLFARKINERGDPDFGQIDIDLHSGKQIVTLGTDGGVRSWDPQTLNENEADRIDLPLPPGIDARPSPFADIKRSPKGRYIAVALREIVGVPATAKEASIARVWDTVKREYINLEPEPKAAKSKATPIYKLEYSPNGNYLLTASMDGNAMLWDTSNWKPRRLVPKPIHVSSAENARRDEPPGLILAVAFDDTEQWLVTGHQSGVVEVFKTSNGENIDQFPAHTDSVLSVDVNHGGNLILTGSADGTAAIWTTDDLFSLGRIAHSDPVIDARFSDDDNFIVTASADNTVRVWENPLPGDKNSDGVKSELGVLVAKFETIDTPWSVRLSHDNKYVAVGGRLGFGEVFDCEACLPFEVLKNLAVQRKPRPLSKAEEAEILNVKLRSKEEDRKPK